MYKVTNRFYTKAVLWLVFILFMHKIYAQDSVLNKYGLWVVRDCATYITTVQSNPEKEMADVKKSIPNIAFDLRYATSNNFMKKNFYPVITTTYIRKKTILALDYVQQDLNKQGSGLKIFDAYRPYSVTEEMWARVKDDRYAANPNKGSNHNRGIAVDLTIINLKTKKELNMGTDFDNFSDTAHHDFKKLPENILQNRLLLKTIMEKYGFTSLNTEWWHYALPDGKEYELLDLSFKELKKITSKN